MITQPHTRPLHSGLFQFSAMTTYTITLTATQAAAISHACEVLARLGMGQYTDALECLPTKELRPDGWNEDMAAIGHILSKHTYAYGVYNQRNKPKRTEMSKVAWDVHQVTRHRLAWDRARADGHTGDKPPTWGVSFDQPLQTSPEPLPQMTAVEPDQTPSKTGTKAKK